MRVRPSAPRYFDFLTERFHRGQAGRRVHLGHWDVPAGETQHAAHPSSHAFERAQARLDEVMLGLAALRDGQSVLDVGCGFGGTLDMINQARRGMLLCGVNVDPRQIGICRSIQAANGNRLAWQEADGCSLPFERASFDRVLCIEAMFHFASRRAFFGEAARVLGRGGVLVATDILIRPAARAAYGPGAALERAVCDGFGPWPDFWGRDADHRALAAAVGLECTRLIDATINTAPSHRHTAPPELDARNDGGDPTARAARALRRLHEDGHLRYLYMRFDKPA